MSVRRTRAAILSFLFGTVFVFGVWGAAPASAACTDTGQIFIRSTSNASNTNGTTNKILLYDRVLDSICNTGTAFCNDPITMSLSTAHISSSAVDPTDDWVEIGWVEFWSTSGHQWNIFTEKGLNGSITNCFQTPAPNLGVGTYDLWRIDGTHKPDNTVDWDLKVDFLISQGFALVKTYNTSWGVASAVASGETERRSPGSAMHDDQVNPQFKNDSGSWVNWPDETCARNTAAPAWLWNHTSNNSYTVRTTGAAC